MRIITNEELIEKRKKWASILSPAALFLLLGGLALNIFSMRSEQVDPIYFYGTMALLISGFIASTIASGLVNQWVKEPRSDQILGQVLKGFDNKNVLLNYTRPESLHILVGQSKVYSITTKPQNGEITVVDNKWRRKFRLADIYRFFASEGLGHPFNESKQNAERLAKFIGENFPEDLAEEDTVIPIEPIIVLTHPDVKLTVESSDIPTLKSSKLKEYIRQSTKGATIKAEVRKQLVEILSND